MLKDKEGGLVVLESGGKTKKKASTINFMK
jgi:hypothetical protein